MIFKRGLTFRFRDMRLSSKLIVTYLLLTVIPLSLLGYLTYAQYARSVEAQIGEYMPKFLYQANADIAKHMNELMKLPEMLFNSEDSLAILRRSHYGNRSDMNRDRYILNGYLTRTYMAGSNPDLIGVYVLSNGRLFQSAKISFREQDWQQSLQRYGEQWGRDDRTRILLPGQIDLRFASDVPYVFLLKPLFDADNRKLLGNMLIAVDLSFIDGILHNFETNERAQLWVMDGAGQIVYHTDRSKIGQRDPEISHYPVKNGSFRSMAGGESRLVSVNQSQALGWVLVHSIPAKVLTERTDFVRNVTIFVFAGIVLVTSLIAVLFSWNVTRPLQRLSSLMKTVERGNFEVDLKVPGGDEVGTLARSFNSMIGTIRELIRENYQIEIRQKEAELYALQSQINPHFMYNTLETIGMAVEEGEREPVVEMVTLLGRMLRFSVSNQSKSVTIGEEVQHVRDYLTIQKYRFEDRLDFAIELHLDDREPHTMYTPKFILQPVVENAIKHGLEMRKTLEIRIAVSREFGARSGKTDLVMRVRDNGPGIPDERLEQMERMLRSAGYEGRSNGFGLSNVNARIVMMHGPQYGIQIHSIKGLGTEVTIRIPVMHALE
ncbi:HAMP domain-containing protein [Cohnella sp. CFH 77786]|uniref:sensor histidine kinase n=1 Tax=Cohnella sp. CFH 77786 TaxID=2662265 RepID=UPI001C610E65|nr:sensor histidine kinase [Cohnella sp. CFH 77786]MBW5446863.1 HAMP domain-containing protein [Cohnella sp. CFH 77786]